MKYEPYLPPHRHTIEDCRRNVAADADASHGQENKAAERLRQAFAVWSSQGTHPDAWLRILEEALEYERQMGWMEVSDDSSR